MNDSVMEVRGQDGKVKEVVLKSEKVLPADVFIVGIGEFTLRLRRNRFMLLTVLNRSPIIPAKLDVLTFLISTIKVCYNGYCCNNSGSSKSCCYWLHCPKGHSFITHFPAHQRAISDPIYTSVTYCLVVSIIVLNNWVFKVLKLAMKIHTKKNYAWSLTSTKNLILLHGLMLKCSFHFIFPSSDLVYFYHQVPNQTLSFCVAAEYSWTQETLW